MFNFCYYFNGSSTDSGSIYSANDPHLSLRTQTGWSRPVHMFVPFV